MGSIWPAGTVGSQLEVLRCKMMELGHEVVRDYTDDGYSRVRLDRPGLDALRDAAEAGLFQQVWCLTPDRLARSHAYQILVLDELARHDLHVLYLDAPLRAWRLQILRWPLWKRRLRTQAATPVTGLAWNRWPCDY